MGATPHEGKVKSEVIDSNIPLPFFLGSNSLIQKYMFKQKKKKLKDLWKKPYFHNAN
jgi:hypothetical protein